MVVAEAYIGLARLVKDNKTELVQIQSTEGSEHYKGEATVFYLRKAVEILETVCGQEHPMLANCYAMVSFCFYDSHKIRKASHWMRKAFCMFYTTLGSFDEVTVKCYNHLVRLEGAIHSKYQYLPLEQLAVSLIDLLENNHHHEEDNDEEEAHPEYFHIKHEDYVSHIKSLQAQNIAIPTSTLAIEPDYEHLKAHHLGQNRGHHHKKSIKALPQIEDPEHMRHPRQHQKALEAAVSNGSDPLALVYRNPHDRVLASPVRGAQAIEYSGVKAITAG